MTVDAPPIVRRLPANRSRVANGSKLLPLTDGPSATASTPTPERRKCHVIGSTRFSPARPAPLIVQLQLSLCQPCYQLPLRVTAHRSLALTDCLGCGCNKVGLAQFSRDLFVLLERAMALVRQKGILRVKYSANASNGYCQRGSYDAPSKRLKFQMTG